LPARESGSPSSGRGRPGSFRVRRASEVDEGDHWSMSRFLVVATAGAGGDLPPLIAAALALRDRGHETFFVADRSVEHTLAGLGVEVRVLPSELDLGPRLVAAIREAMAATGGDLGAAGPLVETRMRA